MARQVINIGAGYGDSSADSANTVFTKTNANFAELYTEFGLTGRQVIELGGTPDKIRDAFEKINANAAQCYTAQGLTGRPIIEIGAFYDDPAGEWGRDACAKVNEITLDLYNSISAPSVVTYYVAKTGNDTTGDGTIGNPYLTIGKARTVVQSGQRIYVRTGTYTETVPSLVAGTASARTILAGYPGETVTIQQTGTANVIGLATQASKYLHFENLRVVGGNYGIQLVAGGFIRFKDVEITGTNFSGVYTSWNDQGDNEFLNMHIHDTGLVPGDDTGTQHAMYIQSKNNIIEGGSIYNITGYGIHLYSGSSTAVLTNNIVRRVRVHTCGTIRGGGMVLGGQGHRVINCLAYNNGSDTNGGYGILINYVSPANAKIFNNTIFGNKSGGIGVINGSSHVARNNICYQTGTAIDNRVGGNLTQSNNLTASNPLFVNAAAGDFKLQNGSPAIDAGFNLGSEVPADFDGVARPQGSAYDIGAYERSA